MIKMLFVSFESRNDSFKSLQWTRIHKMTGGTNPTTLNQTNTREAKVITFLSQETLFEH